MVSNQEFNISICAAVKEKDLANDLIESLKPLPVNIIIGTGISFSKMMNDLIFKNSNSDILIICSHRVRPTQRDVERLITKINEGFGLVCFYRMAFFGFKIDLIKKIGFFDERFIPAGYEDDDFFFRLQEHDIALYEDQSVTYIPGPSLWQQELIEYEGIQFKQPITYKFFIQKWDRDNNTMKIKRKLPEQQTCHILDKTITSVFKKWSESTLLPNNLQKVYKIENNIGIVNKKILIFGGTGSLGTKLVELYNTGDSKNQIYIFSRDENKHWALSQLPIFKNIEFILGDIRDEQRVKEILFTISPHIIIIASAMKHIDKCEFNVYESMLTNTIGTLNICKTIHLYETHLKRLERVVFVSTDKATKPINTYGMTKALSEKIIIEYSKKMHTSSIIFNITRYGNVLNSRGSIIPKLQESTESTFQLTHVDMTRFIMTQKEAVDLITYALLHGQNGDTIVPKLKSMKIKDVFELYCERDHKEYIITSIRPGEKIHEELLNEDELRRSYSQDNYYILPPSYNTKTTLNSLFNDTTLDSSGYSSKYTESKEFILNYLKSHNLY